MVLFFCTIIKQLVEMINTILIFFHLDWAVEMFKFCDHKILWGYCTNRWCWADSLLSPTSLGKLLVYYVYSLKSKDHYSKSFFLFAAWFWIWTLFWCLYLLCFSGRMDCWTRDRRAEVLRHWGARHRFTAPVSRTTFCFVPCNLGLWSLKCLVL